MATEARVLANRYELGPEVGRGGMARVHLARDRLLERTVAVKVLSTLDAHDPTAVERFRREAQAAARLNHPNIVGVYDWGEDDDTAFIVMEYVDGQTLRDVIFDRGRLSALEAARVAAEIADALAFAHRNGVVHRDVKPGNVLITPDGEVKVTDFGIARADSSEGLTKTGAVMGTATYFSPEQAQGHSLDRRSDVYSLGVVLYEMVTGIAPFTADSPVSVAYKHVREEPTPPSAIVPDLSGAMDRIVLTAMAKDVDARYQSADELRADLLRFERGRPLLGGPVTATVAEVPTTSSYVVAAPAMAGADGPVGPPPAPASSRGRGNRWGAVIAIGTALALLLALIVVLIVNSDIGGDGAAAPTADVPLVVGKTFDEAAAALQANGLEVKREDTQSQQPPNLVLAQSPEEGRKVDKGATVTLTVSSPTITAPEVVGKTRDEANTILRGVGLGPIFLEVDSTQPPGTVLSMDPAAGSAVPKEIPVVTVLVAREPAVPIPDVANQDQTPAAAALGQAGFSVTSRAEPSDTVPVGKVIGTDPPAGTPLPKGSAVTLIVSSGPNLIDIPNTVGQPQQVATDALLGAGFNVVIVPQNAGAPNKGKVISQSPPSGKAARLSDVTIVVGQ
ncbi:MAG TPA: Stk1 family PASTA domain-containing Ser/Thr kinase [Acidimicrobiia bacterium]|nr:Stk1 family PASTA domain-containing Ser/Thr kinase [Acidimicrobiia bacterium]